MSKFEKEQVKNALFSVWIAKEYSVVAKTFKEAQEKVRKHLNIDKESFEEFAVDGGLIDTRFEKQPFRRADIK